MSDNTFEQMVKQTTGTPGNLQSVFHREAGEVEGNTYMGDSNHKSRSSQNDQLEGAKYLTPKKG